MKCSKGKVQSKIRGRRRKIYILIPFSLLFTNTGVIKKTFLLDENGQTMWLRYDDEG